MYKTVCPPHDLTILSIVMSRVSPCATPAMRAIPFHSAQRKCQVIIMGISTNPSSVLENYSRKKQSEVLLVHTEDDIVLVYKGMSSSLLKATALDLSESVLDNGTKIKHIDRVCAPYDPSNVQYISQSMSWDDFVELTKE